MKYTEQEQLEEILHRGKELRLRKDKNLLRGLSATATVLLLTLTVCISKLGGKGTLESRTDYGSFLLSAETGGYVLTAVLAFAVGALITVIIYKYRTINTFATKEDNNSERK